MDPTQFSKEELLAFKPSYICSLKPERHPKSAEAEAFSRDYFTTRWPWPSEEAKQRYLGMDIDGYVGLGFPRAKDELLKAACLWYTVYFLIDDMMEQVTVEAQRILRIAPLSLGLVQPREGDAMEEVIFDIYKRCSQGSPKDLERFKAMSEINVRWMEHVLAKSKAAIKGSEPVSYDTLEQFIADRKQEVGAPVLLPSAHWMCGFTPPQAITEHPSIKAVETIALTHATYVNDLYSLRKELKEAAEMKKRANIQLICSNAVLYLSEKCGLGIADAVKALEGQLPGLERRFVEAAEEAELVIGTVLGEEALEMAQEHIETIRLFMAGNVVWHAECGRHNNLDL